MLGCRAAAASPARLPARRLGDIRRRRGHDAAMSDSDSTGSAGMRAVFVGLLLVIGIGLAAMILVPLLGR